ncbi:alpha/beta hydrolase family protein [Methanosarcina sp. UBA289]|uniref:alpha/beta hydrolase family protein n=1 Tax=Methanosarcina sp. UBA289 TaxID=1915574 RepID=UPI0025E051A2|nr:alpha/beta fold hydrolase [Methanosarcina sp. UBA289]
MKRKFIICVVLLSIIIVSLGCVSQSDGSQKESSQLNDTNNTNTEDLKDIEGIWMGNLTVPGGLELRIVFNISTNSDGSINASMDSPDQGVSGIPVESVSYKNDNLNLGVKSIPGSFEGIYKENNKTIEGEWKQSGSAFPLVLEKVEKAPEMHREQDPVKPYPYTEEEVVYENKGAGVKLAGTLTLPRSEGPFPAVILITGSGQQNRNEEIAGHRPFLVLSDYLTRQGIAVLRVDDRGIGGSTGNVSQATTEDFAGDVLTGVEYLKNRKEIDPSRIGLIGHSEGGLIAPMVAVKSQDIAFIVLMAGQGITGEEISYLQSDLIYRAEGVDNETIARNDVLLKSMYSVIKEKQNETIAAEKLHKFMVNEVENMSEEEKKNSGYSEDDLDVQINAQVQNLLSPWMRFFLTYDPAPTLMKVKCPVLAINGEKDLQVPPKENLRTIDEALKAGGNKDYTVKELPGLNHLFQTAKTGSPSEYAKIEETISPAALEIIGNWISEHIQ